MKMNKIPAAKMLDPGCSKARKYYKNRRARLCRRLAKQDPESAPTRNRHGLGGWAD